MADEKTVKYSRLIDMTGKRYGKLLVLERVPNGDLGQTRWKVRCLCGKVFETNGAAIRSGNTRSCGCVRGAYRRRLGERMKKLAERRAKIVASGGAPPPISEHFSPPGFVEWKPEVRDDEDLGIDLGKEYE